MPNEDNKILTTTTGKNSLKVSFSICADIECLLQKIRTCQNNNEKSYAEKKAVHKALGYSLITCCKFDKSENERKYYRGRDCMKMFCNDLKEQKMRTINYEQKPMITLTNEENESYENQQIYHICEREFCTNKDNKEEFKKMQKVRDHCHYTGKYRAAAHSICNLCFKIKKEIPVVFHNGSAYDYHFIIKYLAREFKGYLTYLGENTEKYITFSVPIKKVLDNDNDNYKDKTVTYKLKFIDSYRFMQDSLSNLVDNLSEINNKMSYASLSEKFHNTYPLCNNDLNKFDLLL